MCMNIYVSLRLQWRLMNKIEETIWGVVYSGVACDKVYMAARMRMYIGT